MTERNGPQTGPDVPITEPTVVNFRDPNLRFEMGIKITGMETWKEVNGVFAKLIRDITNSYQPDRTVQRNFINQPNLEKSIGVRDREFGFHGQSTGFAIEVIPTDLSLIKPGQRKTKPDPKLARTFVLSRDIHSNRLDTQEVVVTACTVSLIDEGVFSFSNVYKDGFDQRQNFGAAIYLKPVNENALLKIKSSMTTLMSTTTGRQNPIQFKRLRF